VGNRAEVVVTERRKQGIIGLIEGTLDSGIIGKNTLKKLSGKLGFIAQLRRSERGSLTELFELEAVFCRREREGKSLRFIKLPQNARDCLLSWRNVLQDPHRLRTIIQTPTEGEDILLVSDASTVAVAAMLIRKLSSGGFGMIWTRVEVNDLIEKFPCVFKHERICSNMVHLEMVGTLLGTLLADGRGKFRNVTVLTDNSTVVSILKKGYSKSRSVHKIAKKIFEKADLPFDRAEGPGAHWMVGHLPGLENKLMDLLSRDLNFRVSRGAGQEVKMDVGELCL